VGITYFRNDFDNLVDFDFGPFKYTNSGEVRTQGAEVVADYSPSKEFKLAASYTFTDAVNIVTGLPLVRRPAHKARINARWRFAEKGTLGLSVSYAGEREDYTKTLDAYTLVGLSASFDASEKVRVFARIENLLDEDYEYAAGYGTPGRSFYVGTKITF
jgi:vitamin B12 transporter